MKQIKPIASGGVDSYQGERESFDGIKQRERSLNFKGLSDVIPVGHSIIEEISYDDDMNSDPYAMRNEDFVNSAGLTYSPSYNPEGFIK